MCPPLRRRSWPAPWRSQVPYGLCSTLPPARRIPILSCACWMWTPRVIPGSYPRACSGPGTARALPSRSSSPQARSSATSCGWMMPPTPSWRGTGSGFPSPLPPTDMSLRITTLERTPGRIRSIKRRSSVSTGEDLMAAALSCGWCPKAKIEHKEDVQ